MTTIIPGAFEEDAFTSAFLIAQSYAQSQGIRRAIGGLARPGQGFLIPVGPVYSDEEYVIIRGQLGNASDPFEQHYQNYYAPEDAARVSDLVSNSPVRQVAEDWQAATPVFRVVLPEEINNTEEPVFTVKWKDYAED